MVSDSGILQSIKTQVHANALRDYVVYFEKIVNNN